MIFNDMESDELIPMYAEYPPLSVNLKTHDLGDYLEFGCGTGEFLKFILELNPSFTSVTAVDINAESIDKARESLQDYKINFMVSRKLPLALQGQSFNTITLSNTLHHLKDKENIFRELKRLLKPGGQIIVTEMVCNDLTEAEQVYHRFHALRAAVDRRNHLYHDTTYSDTMIEKIITQAGLKINQREIIQNNKKAVPLEEEIRKIDMLLDDSIRDSQAEQPRLAQEVQEIKAMVRQHGVKRPRQIYLEAVPL